MKLILRAYHHFKCAILSIVYAFLFLIQKNKSVESFLNKCAPETLFITHNFGGGTRTFETNYLDAAKSGTLVCRMISYKRNIYFRLEDADRKQVLYIRTKDFSAVLNYAFSEIIINSLYSLYCIEKYINLLIEYKKKNPSVVYRYFVHDFHCVCPTVNLIADNWNCGLKCEVFKCTFGSLLYGYSGTISEWRSLWTPLFLQTDEIRCFSEDSKKIILTAYPYLREGQISVRPHSMEWCTFTKIQGIERLPIHIGIIGSVYCVSKGKYVVKELLSRLPAEIPVSIIGATRQQIGARRKNTQYFGRYAHSELQSIIERQTISTVIFPSICSETFSYLVSELMQMDIPIICFDFGAQADKVRMYKKGIVVHDTDELIQAILRLKDRRRTDAQPL